MVLCFYWDNFGLSISFKRVEIYLLQYGKSLGWRDWKYSGKLIFFHDLLLKFFGFYDALRIYDLTHPKGKKGVRVLGC